MRRLRIISSAVFVCVADSWRYPQSHVVSFRPTRTTKLITDIRGGNTSGGDENVEIIEIEAIVAHGNESNESVIGVGEESLSQEENNDTEDDSDQPEGEAMEGGSHAVDIEEDEEVSSTSSSEEVGQDAEAEGSPVPGVTTAVVNDEVLQEQEQARTLAAQLRLTGKELHDEGNWEQAAETFLEASAMLEQLPDAAEELATCRLHEALCRLKQLDYDTCAKVCSDVLQDGGSTIPAAIQARAHHRRAKAKLGMGDVSGALVDARSAAFLGDRKAVALYGRLMRETSTGDESSLLSSSSEESSPALLNDLFQGRNPFMPPSGDAGSSALMESLLNKSSGPSNSDSSPLGPLGDMASLLGNMGGKKKKGDSSLAKSVMKSLSKRLEDEATQDTICQYLQNTDSMKLKRLASMGGMTLTDAQATKLASFCNSVTPKKIQKTLKRSKRAWYVISVVRKTMQVLNKYKHIIVLLVLISWVKSAILRPLPINKKAAKKLLQDTARQVV